MKGSQLVATEARSVQEPENKMLEQKGRMKNGFDQAMTARPSDHPEMVRIMAKMICTKGAYMWIS